MSLQFIFLSFHHFLGFYFYLKNIKRPPCPAIKKHVSPWPCTLRYRVSKSYHSSVYNHPISHKEDKKMVVHSLKMVALIPISSPSLECLRVFRKDQ